MAGKAPAASIVRGCRHGSREGDDSSSRGDSFAFHVWELGQLHSFVGAIFLGRSASGRVSRLQLAVECATRRIRGHVLGRCVDLAVGGWLCGGTASSGGPWIRRAAKDTNGGLSPRSVR